MNIFQFLELALRRKKRRRPLYALAIAIGISIVLDIIDSSLYEFFALIGASGMSLYLGYLLLKVLPQGWNEYPLYRLLAYGFIFAGVLLILFYFALRGLQFVGLIPRTS